MIGRVLNQDVQRAHHGKTQDHREPEQNILICVSSNFGKGLEVKCLTFRSVLPLTGLLR